MTIQTKILFIIGFALLVIFITIFILIAWLIQRNVTDVTERKRSEKALQESEKRLSIVLQKAEKANQAKSQFLANMSHELRTPMIAIMGFTELLLEETDLTNEQKYYLGAVHSSSKDLLNIINDILDISRIESGKMGIKAVDFNLNELLANIFNIFKLKVDKKGLEIDLKIADDVPSHLVGDPLRLRQILINLLDNAVKFSQDGKIIVKVIIVKLEAKQITIHFSIQDCGIGISPKATPYLFEAFTQADSSFTRKFGGTGLGLAICKRLINMMEGDIWVESLLGKGSTFSFTVVLGRQTNNNLVLYSYLNADKELISESESTRTGQL